MSEDSKEITVKQVRSAIGRDKRTISTLETLGLGRIGKSRKHKATPDVLGKVRKVQHLVELS